MEEKIDIPFRFFFFFFFFFLSRCRIICRKKGKPSVYRLLRRKGSDAPHLWKRICCVQFPTSCCVQFLVYINKSSLYGLSSIVHTENIKIRPRAKRPGRFSTIKHVFIFFRRFNRYLYLFWDVQKNRIVFQETLLRYAMTLASHISSRKSF